MKVRRICCLLAVCYFAVLNSEIKHCVYNYVYGAVCLEISLKF